MDDTDQYSKQNIAVIARIYFCRDRGVTRVHGVAQSLQHSLIHNVFIAGASVKLVNGMQPLDQIYYNIPYSCQRITTDKN